MTIASKEKNVLNIPKNKQETKLFYLFIKRVFDLFFSLIGLLFLFPFLFAIYFLIKITSKGPGIFKQERVGLNEKLFNIYKFRTMRQLKLKSDTLITQGEKDPRITKMGFFLRKYKIDELPQLVNVLNGSMSFVGPRPEVEKFVKLYTTEQKKVLQVKPGITDLASLEFKDESKILSGVKNIEEFYMKKIVPQKIKLNLEYIKKQSFLYDIKIILMTLKKILKN
ncbi:MAG: sugar transferase [Spirochaetia bacterium]|nr:sugar transferase [Spirochaetia bacterium]